MRIHGAGRHIIHPSPCSDHDARPEGRGGAPQQRPSVTPQWVGWVHNGMERRVRPDSTDPEASRPCVCRPRPRPGRLTVVAGAGAIHRGTDKLLSARSEPYVVQVTRRTVPLLPPNHRCYGVLAFPPSWGTWIGVAARRHPRPTPPWAVTLCCAARRPAGHLVSVVVALACATSRSSPPTTTATFPFCRLFPRRPSSSPARPRLARHRPVLGAPTASCAPCRTAPSVRRGSASASASADDDDLAGWPWPWPTTTVQAGALLRQPRSPLALLPSSRRSCRPPCMPSQLLPRSAPPIHTNQPNFASPPPLHVRTRGVQAASVHHHLFVLAAFCHPRMFPPTTPTPPIRPSPSHGHNFFYCFLVNPNLACRKGLSDVN